jgi:hypothetical protein
VALVDTSVGALLLRSAPSSFGYFLPLSDCHCSSRAI